MNSRRTSLVGAITAPAWASRNSRSMTVCLEKAAPPHIRIAVEVTRDGYLAGGGLALEHAQHRRLARPLEVRRTRSSTRAARPSVSICIDRELRAQCRQALAEALAQMLEPSVLEMCRRRGDHGATEAERDGRRSQIEQREHDLQHGLEACARRR